MSLYNLMFGVNQQAPMLLRVLGYTTYDIPRFRDTYLEDGHVVIYTRTGGGNREFYDEPNDENQEGPWNTAMYEHPNFVRDSDDDFDPTYAYFYFSYPEEYAVDLTALASKTTTYSPSDKWTALLKAMEPTDA